MCRGDGALINDPVDHFSDGPDCRGDGAFSPALAGSRGAREHSEQAGQKSHRTRMGYVVYRYWVE